MGGLGGRLRDGNMGAAHPGIGVGGSWEPLAPASVRGDGGSPRVPPPRVPPPPAGVPCSQPCSSAPPRGAFSLLLLLLLLPALTLRL